MVPVTFSGFWGGYCSGEGIGGRTMPATLSATMSTERPQNFSQENEKEGRGTKFPVPPL